MVPRLAVQVRSHRPESAQRRCGPLRAQLRQVPLQKRLSEVAPPCEAAAVVAGQERARESAAQPEAGQRVGASFRRVEPGHLLEDDAAGEAAEADF